MTLEIEWPANGQTPWGDVLRTGLEQVVEDLNTKITMDDGIAAFVSQFVEGRKYSVVSGTARSSGGTWAIVGPDANHRAANVDAVTQDSTDIHIDFTSLGVTKVVGFLCGPDETFAAQGLTCGASVSRTEAQIRLSNVGAISAYVTCNGTSFSSDSAEYTPSSMAVDGSVTLTHRVLGPSGLRDVSLTPRGATYRPIISTASSAMTGSQVKVQFVDAAGAVATSPNSAMNFSISRTGRGVLNPSDVTTGANVWFLGIFEIA